MKKTIAFLLALAMLTGVLTGCASAANAGDADKFSIVTTIFPEYDWVNQIMGDMASDAEVTLLVDGGVDLHSYQPTAADMITISDCDMFIYAGGQSDSWVKDALANASNQDMVVIDLMEALGDGVKEEEIVEGMEHEGEHGQDEHDGEQAARANDEHIWLSLKNAQLICAHIAQKLAEAHPENKEVYAANANAYIEKLSALDAQYEAAVKAGAKNTLLFGDRFPFRYLTDDYGIDYYAAFPGCSADSEASFETIAFLAQKVDELGLNAVLTIDGVNHKIAETVVSTTASKDAEILSMNSMQSITADDIKNGVTYLSIMEENLDVLKEALQ